MPVGQFEQTQIDSIQLIDNNSNKNTIKPASTPAVAADTAIVVALSPNTPLPAGSQVIGSVSQNGTWTVNQGNPPWQTVSNTELFSGSYPDPSSQDTGSQGPINEDGFGNTMIRGPVISDEGSLRDDFSGTSLTTTLTGTVTFTNGSTAVTGVGTNFQGQMVDTMYIKLSTDSETFYAQISSIGSNTALTLLTPYTGTSGSGTAVASNWATTTGGSISVANSLVTLGSGTANGLVTQIFRRSDFLPFNAEFNLSISQREANQVIAVGLMDNPASPSQQAILQFDGVSNTTCKFITSSSSAASDTMTTVISLPSGILTSAVNKYEIDVTGDSCSLLINGKIIATNSLHIPYPYTVMGMIVSVTNSAVVTNTNVSVDVIYFANLDRLEVTNDFAGDPMPILMQGISSVTGLPTNLNLDANGNLIITPLSGVGSNFTFGQVTTAGTGAQLVHKTVYTEQTTNSQRSFASSSASDTSAGTGIQQVMVTYFDQTGAGPFIETVTLNGTTRVNTTGTNICFIEKIQAARVGSGGVAVGTITLFTTPTSGGTAIGTIAIGDNQTFWAHHYVAVSKTCRISGISGSTDNTSSAYTLLTITAKSIGVTGAPELQVSDSVRVFGGAAETVRNYNSPISVSGPARLFMYTSPSSNSSQNTFAAFDFAES